MRKLLLLVMIPMLLSVSALAQDETRDLAKELANPLASLISVPIQLNYDTNIGLDDDGSLWEIRIQPVIPFSLSEDWELISRTIIPLIDQQDIPTKGEGESGLGDLLQSFFFSPSGVPENGWIWGVGPVLLLPSASDAALGSEKWAVGPTAVVLKQKGPWTVGVLVNHLWSIAGEENREDINATYAEPWVSYVIAGKTTISASIESTYDWESEEASVPVNLIVDRLIQVGHLPIQIGGTVRYWVDSPDEGPEGFGFRLQVTMLFPRLEALRSTKTKNRSAD